MRRELQGSLRQPIWGWFGQRDQFEMGPKYDPAPGIVQHLVGTPSVVGLVAVDEGVALLARAGMPALRAKSEALSALAVSLFDSWLAPMGFSLGTPRDPARRGSHVSICRGDAAGLCSALIAGGVVPDFRAPDSIRFGLAPLYTRFVDVWDAFDRLRRLG